MTTRSEKIQAIRSRREAAKLSGRRLPRKRRPPRQLYPHALERGYERAVLRLLAPYFEAVSGMIEKELPAIAAARDRALKTDGAGVRTDAGYGDLMEAAFDGIRISVARRMAENAIAGAAAETGDKVSGFNAAQVDRQMKTVLGIPVLRQERWLSEKLSAFVLGNVALIKDIPEKSVADLSGMLMARVEAGDSLRTLTGLIEEKLGVARRRAAFIARDQVAKLNGKLTELRQKEVGVEEYVWRAVKDGATRATHLQNDGKRFKWDDPPETGHPGEDYQCRCSAEPVLEEFIEFTLEQAA